VIGRAYPDWFVVSMLQCLSWCPVKPQKWGSRSRIGVRN
jgi:hypothetical protein